MRSYGQQNRNRKKVRRSCKRITGLSWNSSVCFVFHQSSVHSHTLPTIFFKPYEFCSGYSSTGDVLLQPSSAKSVLGNSPVSGNKIFQQMFWQHCLLWLRPNQYNSGQVCHANVLVGYQIMHQEQSCWYTFYENDNRFSWKNPQN